MGFGHFIDQIFCEAVDLFAEIVLFQQVPERENRCRNMDQPADHVDRCESAQRRHLDQRILNRWIAADVTMLEQVDVQDGRERRERATNIAAGLGLRINQINQCIAGENVIHLAKKSLRTPGLPKSFDQGSFGAIVTPPRASIPWMS